MVYIENQIVTRAYLKNKVRSKRLYQCLVFVCSSSEKWSLFQEPEASAVGINIVQAEERSVNCTIIDKSVVWYGNINFFGYNDKEASAMRLADTSVANELLEVIYGGTDEQPIVGVHSVPLP